MLRCPVRDCHQSLTRGDRCAICRQGHSFDIARSGYLNLLQPGERRSRLPGDSKAIVLARRRWHDRGLSAPFLAIITELLQPRINDHLLDVGCGEGFYGGSLAQQTHCCTHGLDISIPAVDQAARRYQESEWIVGNADRLLPYENGVFDYVLSVTARLNGPEFHRVLKDDGKLLIAVPAPDDLIELREEGRDRVEQTQAALESNFVQTDKRRVTYQLPLAPDALADLLLTIYRPKQKPRTKEQEQTVTFSLDLLLFRPRSEGQI